MTVIPSQFIAVLLGYTLLWVILTGGVIDSWIIGIPVVVLATVLSRRLFAPSAVRWQAVALAGFVPFFIWQSLRGGLAVAKLAMQKNIVLSPIVIEYHTRLPDVTSRIFFSSIASLLPGSLVIDIQERLLVVHVINSAIPVQEELSNLEHHVARIFGLDIDHEAPGHG